MIKKKKMPKIFKIFDYKLFLYDFIKWTAAIPTLIFLRIKMIYLNKNAKGFRKKESIIVSNHVTYIDPVIINTVTLHRRILCVATDVLYEKKGMSLLLNSVGCIPINKDNVSVKTFKLVKEAINRGHLVGIFPEGQIVRDDENVSYKMGAVMMAYMSNVPIVPIYIEKRKHWWNRQRIAVGEKIYPKDYTKGNFISIDEMQIIANYIKDVEESLKQKLNENRR